jgi:G6PDH family F420-dependent oxidoreductase
MKIGYKLIAEAYSPQEMVRQAVRAEEAGFDFVEISDHFHPWFDSQNHSGFSWSILAAAAMRTEHIELATGVTCPFIRYHPAVMAQAAATTALLSEGRFTFGVGTGERLNEHVVGRGWPAVRARHEMFRESLEIIRLLWSGASTPTRASTSRSRTRGFSTCRRHHHLSRWRAAARFGPYRRRARRRYLRHGAQNGYNERLRRGRR